MKGCCVAHLIGYESGEVLRTYLGVCVVLEGIGEALEDADLISNGDGERGI